MDAVVQALEPHALLLALVLPVAIRLAGHWLPEEPLMVAIGALATRGAPTHAAALFAVLWSSHAATDYGVYSFERFAAPRLERWPPIPKRVRPVAERIAGSRWALAALIHAGVPPLGRGAWLAGFGLAGVPRWRFAAADAAAVAVFLLVWFGHGWWAGPRIVPTLAAVKPAALWLLAGTAVAAGGALAWRRYRAT